MRLTRNHRSIWSIIRDAIRKIVKPKQKKRRIRKSTNQQPKMRRYNCARVYIGEYIGGGTNEDEENMKCGYQILDGYVIAKKIRPIRVQETTSEGRMVTLRTFVLYPKTETAIVKITNGHRTFTLQLVKAHTKRSTMFKLRL